MTKETKAKECCYGVRPLSDCQCEKDRLAALAAEPSSLECQSEIDKDLVRAYYGDRAAFDRVRATLAATPAVGVEREALEKILQRLSGPSSAQLWDIRQIAEGALAAPPASPLRGRDELHPDTQDLVEKLSWALEDKLLRSQKKYGYTNGWLTDDWKDECQLQLMEHLEKGDPLDVVAYAAFMWARGWPTASPPEQPAAECGDPNCEDPDCSYGKGTNYLARTDQVAGIIQGVAGETGTSTRGQGSG